MKQDKIDNIGFWVFISVVAVLLYKVYMHHITVAMSNNCLELIKFANL